jgi:hypothetical protein
MELDTGSLCLMWGDIPENGKVERNNIEWRIHHHHPNKNELKYSSVCPLSVKTCSSKSSVYRMFDYQVKTKQPFSGQC